MELEELKKVVKDFFSHDYQQYSIYGLMKKLNINRDYTDLVIDALYELEKEGYVFYDNNHTFMHAPEDFYYGVGVLTKSNSNHYYVKLKDGVRVIIKNKNKAKEGDYVVVTKRPSKHPKSFVGEIVRVVEREKRLDKSHYIIRGFLKKEGKHFYVMDKNNRIYIPKEKLNTAFQNDLVNVSVNGQTGSVIEVLHRHLSKHVFECINHNGKLVWIPIGPSYGMYEVINHKYHEGDRIYASILNNQLSLIQDLKRGDSIQDLIDGLIMDYGFMNEFSPRVLEEANDILKNSSFINDDKRVDLRELETFTIDPIDAKDLDDAVSLVYDNGIYHLYVHTANPSHYVKLNSSIFQEALRRGFSVYPVTNVIPMLPDVFSSGVCSLNENGDKLAITCRLDIDNQGNVVDIDIFKSIIKSDKQMDYDAVNLFLSGNDNKDYLPFKDTIFRMKELALILDRKKTKRGALSFGSDEKEFILDDNNNPIGIREEQRGDAQAIIENFMILANSCIATYALNLELPFIYRNHDKPTVQRSANLKNNLIKSGYVVRKIDHIDNPVILQRYLFDLLKGRNKEEKKFICEIFLKSMTRAFYDLYNIGHYGLALECYGTFTSPARKISDLINHMIIDEFLDNKDVTSSQLEIYREFIKEWCEYISLKQKDADMLEIDINQLMLSRYADNFIGQEVNAKILFINKSGIYIKDEHGLTGVIPINKNNFINVNLVRYQGVDYKVGDQVCVILKNRNDRELFFELGNNHKKKLVRKK